MLRIKLNTCEVLSDNLQPMHLQRLYMGVVLKVLIWYPSSTLSPLFLGGLHFKAEL